MSVVLGGNCADLPGANAGEWQIRTMDFGAAVTGPYLLFTCPRGRGTCGVPIAPSPPNAKGCAWQWDGNAEAPTLSPSINCIEADENGRASGCGWHGFMRAGKLEP